MKIFLPLAGLYAGSYPMVVINDWKLAKELFAKEVFAGRLRQVRKKKLCISNPQTSWNEPSLPQYHIGPL
jgi:hypothetical protein